MKTSIGMLDQREAAEFRCLAGIEDDFGAIIRGLVAFIVQRVGRDTGDLAEKPGGALSKAAKRNVTG